MNGDDKQSKPLVLFIHGLGGDGKTTWGSFRKLINEDALLNDKIDVAFYSYPSALFRFPFGKNSIRIQDLANAVRTEIEFSYRGYSKIILVCHSMGGIVARKYLVEEVKQNRDTKVKAALLFAVPNSGADLARWGGLISWRHWQLKQLSKGSDFLEAINSDWVNLSCGSVVKVHRIVAGQDAVVPRIESGANDDTYHLADKDHGTIVKPLSHEDGPYKIFKGLVSDILELTGAPVIAADSSVSAQSNLLNVPYSGVRPPALFDIYRSEFERYYVARREDLIVAGYLAMQNLWVFGGSGLGKTAALTRALARGAPHRLVSLGHYAGGDVRQLYCGMYESILQSNDVRIHVEALDWPRLIESIVGALERLASSGIRALLIEEIPLAESATLQQFFAKLFLILTLYASRSSGSLISFAFSSVTDPRDGMQANGRLPELLKVIPFPAWKATDVQKLIGLIQESTGLNLSREYQARMIVAANGSPRFVKVFFVNLLNVSTFTANGEQAFDEALAATMQEIAR